MIWALLLTLFCAADDWETQGQLSIFYSSMPQQPYEDVTKDNGGVSARLELQKKLSQEFTFDSKFWGSSDGLTKTTEEKNQADIDELSLKWRRRQSSFKVGLSTVNWEGTDVLNPVDIIGAKNARDIFAIKPRSSAGIFYSDAWQKVSWDVVYIPLQRKTLLPGNNSPWWPRKLQLPLETDSYILRIPDNVRYDILEEEILDKALEHEFALRLQYHGESWDLSLAASDAAASTPLLYPIFNLNPIQVLPVMIYQMQTPIRIQPVIYRQKTVAFAASILGETTIWRLAAQHAQPMGTDSRLTDWSSYGVFSLEKNIELSTQNLILLFQATNSRRAKSESLISLSSLLENAAMVGARWPFKENWTLSFAHFYENKFGSQVSHAEINWGISEHWSSQLSADLLNGKTDSLVGVFNDNDRYLLKATYSF